jgi:hypothetical protein
MKESEGVICPILRLVHLFHSLLPSLSHSADKVFRTQQINKWKGAKPDPKQKPKTAGEAARKGMSYYQMLQCEDG